LIYLQDGLPYRDVDRAQSSNWLDHEVCPPFELFCVACRYSLFCSIAAVITAITVSTVDILVADSDHPKVCNTSNDFHRLSMLLGHGEMYAYCYCYIGCVASLNKLRLCRLCQLFVSEVE
jgi:hypothetical protein